MPDPEEVPDEFPLSEAEMRRMDHERDFSRAELVHRSAMARKTPAEMFASGEARLTPPCSQLPPGQSTSERTREWVEKNGAQHVAEGFLGYYGMRPAPRIPRPQSDAEDALRYVWGSGVRPEALANRQINTGPTYADDDEVVEAEIMDDGDWADPEQDDAEDAEIVDE